MIEWLKANSVIRYKQDQRRQRITELGELGLNQEQIAEKTGYSLRTIQRDIQVIREGLV
jgi:transcriptional antiterminator